MSPSRTAAGAAAAALALKGRLSILPRVLRRRAPRAGACRARRRRGRPARAAALALAAVALAGVAMLSVSVGSRPIPLDRVWSLVAGNDGSRDALIVHELRIPRTLLGLLVGAALGLAGALMQALTRNPLADPGLLGVNAGAVARDRRRDRRVRAASASATYVWFAFAGAAAASVLVYRLGSPRPRGATPVRLALAGTAVTAALLAIVSGGDAVRRRARSTATAAGSSARSPGARTRVGQIAPFVAAGWCSGCVLPRALNALALGDDASRALGANVEPTRVAGFAAITLLCGAATAAAGPIAFIGLAVPHMTRAVTGPDQRWVLPFAVVLAPMLLLAADVVGRVIAPPGEIPVGVVAAFLGGPLFIALVRRRRVAQL